MNCDRVFEILTRGPFPSGDPSDAPVEQHLAACHECRQLAEALRPAVALFHESVAADQWNDLPSYQGALERPVERDFAASVQRAIEADQRRESSRSGVQIAMQLIGAIAVGIALCLTFGSLPSSTPAGGVPSNPTARFQPDEQGLVRLASLSLPAGCLTPLAATGQRFCCTECHSTAQPQRPAIVSFARLEQSCNACHGGH